MKMSDNDVPKSVDDENSSTQWTRKGIDLKSWRIRTRNHGL